MQAADAVEFVVTLATAGTQAAAAKVIGRSQAVISDRLKKARFVLGDDRVKELLIKHARDESCRVNLLKPFIINQPVCGKCGGVRTLSATGTLVCRACANERNAEYKERNADRVAAASAAYYEKNKEAICLRTKAYYAENREAILTSVDKEAKKAKDAAYYVSTATTRKAVAKTYREANRDKVLAYFADRRKTDSTYREAKKAHLRAWKQRHPDRVNAQTAKRHAAKLRAIPSWASLKDIADIYALAKLRSKLTGIEWHVDHTVPLNSDIVCGLHCEANLQVIPAGPNISKGNAWWPDMPDAPADCVTFAERPSLYLVPPATPAPLLTERLIRPAGERPCAVDDESAVELPLLMQA